MKKLFALWKHTITKYFDINQNGKLDFIELLLLIVIISIYNIFFQVVGNYIYDIIK